MTRDQYHAFAPTFDRKQQQFDRLVERIPLNINRAGKVYRQKLQAIRKEVYGME